MATETKKLINTSPTYAQRNINLQISILEDRIDLDSIRAPVAKPRQVLTAYLSKSKAKFDAKKFDITNYILQFPEYTAALHHEFQKLYRCVVLKHTSKDLKHLHKDESLWISLEDLQKLEIQSQSQKLRKAANEILDQLTQFSADISYADRILKRFIQHWVARYQQQQRIISELPLQSQSCDSSSVVIEVKPSDALSRAAERLDPYSKIEEPKSFKTKPISFMGILMGAFSAILTFANPFLFADARIGLPLIGILAKHLNSLSLAAVLGLELGTGILAISCAILLAVKGAKGIGYKAVSVGCLLTSLALSPLLIINPFWSIPLILANALGLWAFYQGRKHNNAQTTQSPVVVSKPRMPIERLEIDNEWIFDEDNARENEEEASEILANLNTRCAGREEKPPCITPPSSSLVGQRLKSRLIYGINHDFPSATINILPAKPNLISPDAALPDSTETSLTVATSAPVLPIIQVRIKSCPLLDNKHCEAMELEENKTIVDLEEKSSGYLSRSSSPSLITSSSFFSTPSSSPTEVSTLTDIGSTSSEQMQEDLTLASTTAIVQEPKEISSMDDAKHCVDKRAANTRTDDAWIDNFFKIFLNDPDNINLGLHSYFLRSSLKLYQEKWNQSANNKMLQKIFTLPRFPDAMLEFYRELEKFNIGYNQTQRSRKYPVVNFMNKKVLLHAIVTYEVLYKSIKIGGLPTKSSSLLKSWSRFFSNYKEQRITAAKIMLEELQLKITLTYFQYRLERVLEDIPRLPWSVCRFVLCGLILVPEDSSGNTLLHQLVKNKECSIYSFQVILEKARDYYISKNDPKLPWHSYLTHCNHAGEDAAKIAFSKGRFDIYKLLQQYIAQKNSEPSLWRK